MAGAMRKMAVYLGLVEDDQYEDESMHTDPTSDPRDQATESSVSRSSRYGEPRTEAKRADTLRVSERDEDEVARRRQGTERSSVDRLGTDRPSQAWRTDTVANEPVGTHPAGSRARSRSAARPGAEGYKITTLHPRSYNDARRIGEEFREGTPVIMNLTELDDTDAKRIVDFAAGLVFGLRGSIERVTNKVFMLSPANVQVGADQARAQLEQDGYMSKR
ncbi:MAG: cell division protein SepF [Actinomycetes bacterium]